MMGDSVGALELGSIVCKHCGTLIDTLDTERVIIYYSRCDQWECVEEELRNEAKR